MDTGYHRIPIIKLWHLLLVPLQGEVTDDLAERLITEVLHRVHEDRTTGLVIDITGLWMVDSHLCSVLSQLSAAASLMGASTVISGMKPDIALTLETMGVELKGVRTTLDLEEALYLLGVPEPEGDPADRMLDLEEADERAAEEEEADERRGDGTPERARGVAAERPRATAAGRTGGAA